MTDAYNILLLVVGCSFLFFASKQLNKRKRLITNGIAVEGIVFAFENSSGFDDRTRNPIIRFVTKEGLWITEPADVAPITFLLKAGQKVKVVYNPDNPKEFNYKTTFDFSKLTYLILVAGIGFLLAGIWFAYKYIIK